MTQKGSALLVCAMALLCLAGTSARADAALIAYICDDMLCTGGNDTIVTDQGPGDNFPGSVQVGQINAGAINFAGFTIMTNVAQSKPLIGSAAAPQMDLTFSVVSSDNLSHTIFLYASDTGFTGTGALALSLDGTQPPFGAGNTVRGRAWGGTSNTELDISGANLRADTGTTGATPFDVTLNGFLPAGVNPYSLTIGVTITRTAPGTSTGDLNVSVTPVPEPASMLLLWTGLFGAGVRRWRQKRA